MVSFRFVDSRTHIGKLFISSTLMTCKLHKNSACHPSQCYFSLEVWASALTLYALLLHVPVLLVSAKLGHRIVYQATIFRMPYILLLCCYPIYCVPALLSTSKPYTKIGLSMWQTFVSWILRLPVGLRLGLEPYSESSWNYPSLTKKVCYITAATSGTSPYAYVDLKACLTMPFMPSFPPSCQS